MYTLQAASRAAVHHLVGRRAPTPGLHPTITLATHEGSGLYRIPDDYVVLKPQFNGGFIVLSFAIAFVGSLCTLELLTRRTSNSGWRNQVLLGSAGVTFGAVSTFAMHFVFNNSLSLHHPYHAKHYPAIYLSYDPGITVLSLVVSCLAMIMAFFVMGTHLSDWYCMPGRRERKGSNSSHATSQHDEDEYGNWKSSHAKMLRTGTVGMVALLQRAGAVAKWSSMDPVEEGEKRGWKTALKDISSKDEKADEREFEGPFGDDEEAIIKHDKKLAELDFRLGRSAVKLELEHRQDKTQTSPVTSFSHVGSSVRLIPSNSSLPQTPLPILHPPFSRRRSLPLNEMPDAAASAEVPGHDFHFASRADTEQSPPIDTESASANHSLAWRPGYPQMSDFSTTPPTDPQRRGSLPDASFNRPASNGIRSGLMRIQSMSEVEQKAASMARIPSDEEKFDRTMTSPTLSVTAQLNTLEATRDPSVPEKRVRIVGKRTLSKLEKFLGFDVVTTAEIIKIFITGTIAGFGVVGMRQSLVAARLVLTSCRLHWAVLHHRLALHCVQGALRCRIHRHRVGCRDYRPLHHVHHASAQAQAHLAFESHGRHDPRCRRMRHAFLR